MRARLKIVGKKDLIDLSYIEGKAAEQLILDTNQSQDTPFSIEGVWTGRKRQMDYVDFYQEEKAYKDKSLKFDAGDGMAFEKQISHFLDDKGYLTMEKEFELLASRHLISLIKKKPDGECKTVTDFDFKIYTGSVVEYQCFCDQISAWKDWRGRKDFGEKKEIEHLEKLAEQMSVN